MKKPLPIISTPTLTCILPLSKEKVTYRPFVVKEQKALLLAQESRDNETIVNTVRDVLYSCSSGTLNYSKIPAGDLAYFFVQLRIASVGSDALINLACTSCEKQVPINLDLSSVKFDTVDINSKIMLTDTVGIIMRMPSVDDAAAFEAAPKETRHVVILNRLFEQIFDNETVYVKDDYTEEEFSSWIDDFNEDMLLKIQAFVDSIPTLKLHLDFDCPHCKEKNSRVLEDLQNFF
jgi:T4 bacteriophage base plate protein